MRRQEEATEAHMHQHARRVAAHAARQVILFWQKINKVCASNFMDLAEMTSLQLILHKEAFSLQIQQKAELEQQLGAFTRCITVASFTKLSLQECCYRRVKNIRQSSHRF